MTATSSRANSVPRMRHRGRSGPLNGWLTIGRAARNAQLVRFTRRRPDAHEELVLAPAPVAGRPRAGAPAAARQRSYTTAVSRSARPAAVYAVDVICRWIEADLAASGRRAPR